MPADTLINTLKLTIEYRKKIILYLFLSIGALSHGSNFPLMVHIWDGSSEHVAHVWFKMGLFRKRIGFDNSAFNKSKFLIYSIYVHSEHPSNIKTWLFYFLFLLIFLYFFLQLSHSLDLFIYNYTQRKSTVVISDNIIHNANRILYIYMI